MLPCHLPRGLCYIFPIVFFLLFTATFEIIFATEAKSQDTASLIPSVPKRLDDCTMAAIQIVPGFSLTNRLLLYASTLLAPAQLVSGIRNNCPSNLGFLAYNLYTQVQWYRATRAKQLQALSLLPTAFNFFFSLSYLGGVTSGNPFMATILGLGTAAAIFLNHVSGWFSWETNQPEGFGVYQFFFFGWRTLTPRWHILTLLWQIGDTMITVAFVIAAVLIIVGSLEVDDDDHWSLKWYGKYLMIPLGAACMLLVIWIAILFIELIVARNQIESATDWIAVWLFVAQVGALLLPSHKTFFGCVL